MKETDTRSEREIDRQTDRQTNTQTDTQTITRADTHTEKCDSHIMSFPHRERKKYNFFRF